MKPLILKIIRTLLIAAVLILFIWLIAKNFPSSGQLVFNVDFAHDQPFLSKLKPDSRLDWQGTNAVVKGSPIYFNLRIIQLYPKARFVIIYQSNGRVLTEMGGKTSAGWSYDLHQSLVDSDLGDGWRQAIFDFDLGKLYRPRNFMEFIINSSGDDNQTLIIKQIQVILMR